MLIRETIFIGCFILSISYGDNTLLKPNVCCSNQPITNQSLPQAKQPIKLNNDHIIDQKIIIALPKKDPTDCTQLCGKELLDYMACQSPENLKKNIMNFNDRMAHHYFLSLSLESYYEVLQHFTEDEWKAFYESRKPEMREYFPKTLEEQRLMLKTAYLDACYSFFERLWLRKSNTNADLQELVNIFNKKHMNGTMDLTTCKNTHSKFHWMRKKLFAKS